MFALMVVVFVLGYIAIALEHPLHLDKAATALLIGALTWVVYVLDYQGILGLGYSEAWQNYIAQYPEENSVEGMLHFVVDHEVFHHLGDIASILFFLMGAMTIVEIIDRHQGFKIITDQIHTTGTVKLLWIVGILTFFMSSVLDNLTTTIVMVAMLRKLIDDKETRWVFASIVVLAANAGGAWSPIGDVTTIMLWIGGQVTAASIIMKVFLPSIVSILVPLAFLSFIMKGEVKRPVTVEDHEETIVPRGESMLILIMGVSILLLVPVFKTLTHLPPYMGMLLGLGILWMTTEIIHKSKPVEVRSNVSVVSIIRRVDMPTVLFFLGILSAVASLQSAGQLNIMANFLDEKLGNIYLINIAIGFLSSVIDNVPLVAGAMGMYQITDPAELALMTDAVQIEYLTHFLQDGLFWEFLAFCAGTGGSILIIGSAAGVAAMGMERIDFIWYLKRISWLAVLGYLAGAGVYYLQAVILHLA